MQVGWLNTSQVIRKPQKNDVCYHSFRVLPLTKLASALAHLKTKKTALCSAKNAKIACCAYRGLQKTARNAQWGSKRQRASTQKSMLGSTLMQAAVGNVKPNLIGGWVDGGLSNPGSDILIYLPCDQSNVIKAKQTVLPFAPPTLPSFQ